MASGGGVNASNVVPGLQLSSVHRIEIFTLSRKITGERNSTAINYLEAFAELAKNDP
jgi:hypothetical protein